MTAEYTVGYVEKNNKNVIIHCAMYANYNEAKAALLNIIGAIGLNLLEDPKIKHKETEQLAQAAIDLILMQEEAMEPDSNDPDKTIMSFGTQHTLLFIKKGDASDMYLIAGDSKTSDISVEIMADHRQCTDNFCFSSLSTNQN